MIAERDESEVKGEVTVRQYLFEWGKNEILVR